MREDHQWRKYQTKQAIVDQINKAQCIVMILSQKHYVGSIEYTVIEIRLTKYFFHIIYITRLLFIYFC